MIIMSFIYLHVRVAAIKFYFLATGTQYFTSVLVTHTMSTTIGTILVSLITIFDIKV